MGLSLKEFVSNYWFVWVPVFANQCLSKCGFYPLTETRRQKTLSSWIITSYRDGPRSLNKTILSCEVGKRLGKDFYLKGAKREREKNYNKESKSSKKREVRGQ